MKAAVVAALLALPLMHPALLRGQGQTQGRPLPSTGAVLPGVEVKTASLTRSGDYMTVDLDMSLGGLEVPGSHAVVLTPGLVNGRDTLRLWSVGLYGRQRWYYYQRNGGGTLTGGDERPYPEKERPKEVSYHEAVPYAEWMNGSELVLTRRDYGCCSDPLGGQTAGPLAEYRRVDYKPEFVWQSAVAEAVKTRELSGRAYIDFPVNRTEIYPDYRGNRAELGKIIATIDSVKNDKDIEVTSIAIKGFASPEGSYQNNIRLAQGRTETLKNYVQQLYRFPAGFIATDYEPEDWAGLREYVETATTLLNRGEILSIIDDPFLDPDIKDKRIQARYGDDYRFLLANVYPGLRHSDYRIEYTIRGFSDPVEIRELLRTAPQKLSLNEIYLAVQGLEPGSEEYNEIFETAVRLFPSEEVANLNAANAAMQRGDLTGASRYLDRAGESVEAVYARGVLAALRGDYDEALARVREASSRGMDTGGTLEHLEEVKRYAPSNPVN